jgi:hypothetical protein
VIGSGICVTASVSARRDFAGKCARIGVDTRVFAQDAHETFGNARTQESTHRTIED